MSFADSAPNNVKYSAMQPKVIALTFYKNSSGAMTVTNQCEVRYELSSASSLLDRISRQKVSYNPGSEVKQIVPKN